MRNYLVTLIVGMALGCCLILFLKNQNKNLIPMPLEKIEKPEFPIEFEKNKKNDETQIPWLHNYQESLVIAKKYKRPMFVYFGADWCSWCKKMENTTFSDLEVKEKLEKNCIGCFLNFDRQKQVAKKLKVSGIPAYFIIDPITEKNIASDTGYKSKDEFLYWLKTNMIPKKVSFPSESEN